MKRKRLIVGLQVVFAVMFSVCAIIYGLEGYILLMALFLASAMCMTATALIFSRASKDLK